MLVDPCSNFLGAQLLLENNKLRLYDNVNIVAFNLIHRIDYEPSGGHHIMCTCLGPVYFRFYSHR